MKFRSRFKVVFQRDNGEKSDPLHHFEIFFQRTFKTYCTKNTSCRACGLYRPLVKPQKTVLLVCGKIEVSGVTQTVKSDLILQSDWKSPVSAMFAFESVKFEDGQTRTSSSSSVISTSRSLYVCPATRSLVHRHAGGSLFWRVPCWRLGYRVTYSLVSLSKL